MPHIKQKRRKKYKVPAPKQIQSQQNTTISQMQKKFPHLSHDTKHLKPHSQHEHAHIRTMGVRKK